jgi:hypothetical protein
MLVCHAGLALILYCSCTRLLRFEAPGICRHLLGVKEYHSIITVNDTSRTGCVCDDLWELSCSHTEGCEVSMFIDLHNPVYLASQEGWHNFLSFLRGVAPDAQSRLRGLLKVVLLEGKLLMLVEQICLDGYHT